MPRCSVIWSLISVAFRHFLAMTRLERICTDFRLCVFSSFHSERDENCVLLGYYAASRGISLPTFRDNLSIPSSRVKNPRRRSGSTTSRSVISQESAVFRPQNAFPNVSLAFLYFFVPRVCKIASSAPVATLPISVAFACFLVCRNLFI
jgi:hypothetical protein